MDSLDVEDIIQSGQFALLVLNQQIVNTKRALQLWTAAKVKVLVDGGANQWNQCLNSDISEPDLVTGDFDSIEKELLERYQKSDRVKVVPTPDQVVTSNSH